ncbi:MAG: major membrane immunogen (membrane-anchored lipoprotein), partial [Polaribacter sp.]
MKSALTKVLIFGIFSILLVNCSNSKGQKQFTVAEYEAAAKHMDRNLNSLVYNQVSESSFVNGNKLLYSTTNKDGKKFVLVDATSKTKEAAFDHEKLAEILAVENGQEVRANALPISNVSLSEDLKS